MKDRTHKTKEWIALVKDKKVASANTFNELVTVLKKENLLEKSTITRISPLFGTLKGKGWTKKDRLQFKEL